MRGAPSPIVTVTDTQGSLKIDEKSVVAVVRAVLKWRRCPCDQVDIHFVTSEDIAKLHAEHFGDPSPTDCISFPQEREHGNMPYHLGEVFVCPFVAKSYARLHKLSPYEETTLYVVHGLLHLMGYDDIEPKPRGKMLRLQRDLLKRLLEHHLCLAPPKR